MLKSKLTLCTLFCYLILIFGCDNNNKNILSHKDIVASDETKLICKYHSHFYVKSDIWDPNHLGWSTTFVLGISEPNFVVYYNGPKLQHSFKENDEKSIKKHLSKIDRIISGEEEFYFIKDNRLVEFFSNEITGTRKGFYIKDTIIIDRTSLLYSQLRYGSLSPDEIPFELKHRLSSKCSIVSDEQLLSALKDLELIWKSEAIGYISNERERIRKKKLQESKNKI